MARFKRFTVAQVLRVKNIMADALANLASDAFYPCHVELDIMDHPSIHNVAVLTAESQAGNSWISPISNYLRNGALLEDRSVAVKVKARAARYALVNDTLYRWPFFGPY